MDESLLNHEAHVADELAAELRAQRAHAHQFFHRWQGSSAHLEQQLLAQVDAAMRQIAQLQDDENLDTDQRSGLPASVVEAESHLERLVHELTDRQLVLDAAQAQFAAERRELDQRHAALTLDAQRLHEENQQQEQAAAELQKRAQEIDDQSRRIELRARQVADQEQSLHARKEDLLDARKRLARELRRQRAEHLVEIAARQAQLDAAAAAEDAELEQQLEQFTAELSRVREQTHERGEQVERLRNELESARAQLARRDAENRELAQRLDQIASSDQHRSSETALLGSQLAEARERAASQHAAAQVALAQAREDNEELRGELARARQLSQAAHEKIAQLEGDARQLRGAIDQAEGGAAAVRIKLLEQERDALVERLADAEELASVSSPAADESDELRRRFEMALDDVRSLKARNAELEERLQRGQSAGLPVVDSKMDWESQKRRMLAQLEADFDENDPQEAKDRLTVAGAMQITDGIVAQKESEIAELQRLLAEQSQSIGGVAVGAAAIAQLLDGDELIRSEREKIEALQTEWREKLRKAEIDISVERAKIARERAQLEEKLQTMASRSSDAELNGGDDTGKKKKGSRWLSRLGLSEDEK